MSIKAVFACLVGTAVIVGCGCIPSVGEALSGARVYEMVSPSYKGGYGATEVLATAVGDATGSNRAVFFSLGAFGGAPSGVSEPGYLSYRTETGWLTTPIQPPAAIAPEIGARDYTPQLDQVLLNAGLGPNAGAATYISDESELLTHNTLAADTEANWSPIGGVVMKPVENPGEEYSGILMRYEGASQDFCYAFVNSAAPLLSEAVGRGSQLYELTGCGGGPSLGLVGLNNEDKLLASSCDIGPGPGGNDESNAFNAFAADGRQVFFSACLGIGKPELFVRLDGSRTLEVSKPLLEGCPGGGEVPCPGASTRASAQFVGANEAGTVVYFMTTESLVTGDTDGENDLYAAAIECPGGGIGCEVSERAVTSLTQVSRDPRAGESADVEPQAWVAPDGSRVYFVARGVLTEAPDAEGDVAVGGAENLYVHDIRSGMTSFVADLCSSAEASGSVEDPHCPPSLSGSANDSQLWLSAGQREGQTAGSDGRFLVFPSYGQLTPDDTDTAKDIYRYDAQEGTLERVSLGEAGHDSNGNNNEFDAAIAISHVQEGTDVGRYKLATRAISEDGSRIVFRTAEELSPQAVNHLENAYEWHRGTGESAGQVALISSGTDEQDTKDVAISPSGHDVFFVTNSRLAPQDHDDAQDVYDARIDGGFPASPAGTKPCTSDACQGPFSSPAPLLVPASATVAPGGNLAPPKPKPKAKRAHNTKRHKAHPHRRKARRHAGRSH